MYTTDLAWEGAHPSLLIPRLKEVADESNDPSIPKLVFRVQSAPQAQKMAEPPLTETETEVYLKAKATVCVQISHLIFGALGTPEDLENQAFDLMYLPVDQLVKTGERITRLKGAK
jgi:hypothetical protein